MGEGTLRKSRSIKSDESESERPFPKKSTKAIGTTTSQARDPLNLGGLRGLPEKLVRHLHGITEAKDIWNETNERGVEVGQIEPVTDRPVDQRWGGGEDSKIFYRGRPIEGGIDVWFLESKRKNGMRRSYAQEGRWMKTIT